MTRILVNGISAKSGGGRSILRNFLGALDAVASGHQYLIVAPAGHGFEEFDSATIRVLPVEGADRLSFLLRFSLSVLPRLLRDERCDLLFNVSDIPVPTAVPQAFLFDWSYAAFPESPAWALSGPKERLIRTAKLLLFKRYLKYVTVLIAQNEVLKERLERLYALGNVAVIPNAVSLENLSVGASFDFDLGAGFKLLCLSRYYSHKNIEIFLPAARLMRERGIDAKIITTFSAEQHPKARIFFEQVSREGLERIIHNVGPVPMAHVPSLYRQTDALLLPTLLESFSGTYVEAMFHGKPILTSRLEFAKGVCKDAAFYFDPQNPVELVDCIQEVQTNPAEAAAKVALARGILNALPDWDAAAAAFVGIFDHILAKRGGHTAAGTGAVESAGRIPARGQAGQ